ncbi:MAG TPA: glycosyltransferase family 1 protein [Caldilineaceae bacterium]|nr:glycosyltransferase family 1 protein [Caldilineaceae bacterium]
MTVVAIDYTPAVRQQAGIGRIIRGQVQALLAAPDGYHIRLFVAGPIDPAEQAAAPLPIHATPIGERNLVRLWHRLDLPWPRVEWFTGGPLDLLHATDFVLPPSRARRKILTIHDLAFLFYPEAAMPSLHHYLNVVVPRSVRRADFIIADSRHTARDLQSVWDVPAEQIAVVQGAVDHAHFRPISDPARLAEVRRRYQVGDGPYILAVSRLEPRKNHVRLIEAFHQARVEARLPHRLVIGGAKGWLYDAIFRRVQELGLGEAVHFPGFIADADLPALYSGADFVAYPSLYEGFGLPIIESLACGTPVLTGDNSCLPEAGGPGALYVQAEQVESIAQGILRLAGDPALRARLRAAGLAHAAAFTWERSAAQLRNAYAAALR